MWVYLQHTALMTVMHEIHSLFQIATTPCSILSKSPNALGGYVATV